MNEEAKIKELEQDRHDWVMRTARIAECFCEQSKLLRDMCDTMRRMEQRIEELKGLGTAS